MATPDLGGTEVGTARIAEVHVYPFKSAAGISVDAWPVDPAGLHLDRQWMLVDGNGAFVTQRTAPRMALMGTGLEEFHLQVTFPGHAPLRLSMADEGSGPEVAVKVWFTDRWGRDCGDEAAQWASDALGMACRVLRAATPPQGDRVTGEGLVRHGFADARPALVVSTASLEDLNGRLCEPVPMNRFRPNVVVTDTDAYQEERWGVVRGEHVAMRGLRPCPRCVLTTVDQATGVSASREPLATLSAYRPRTDAGVPFGMCVGFDEEGVLRVGDVLRHSTHLRHRAPENGDAPVLPPQ